jgi:hypothetical protein
MSPTRLEKQYTIMHATYVNQDQDNITVLPDAFVA